MGIFEFQQALDRSDRWLVVNRLQSDKILLDEYLRRDLLITPDLTILLKADKESVVQRIKTGKDSSEIDRIFMSQPDLIISMNNLIETHLIRLGREYIVLDTVNNTINDCKKLIISSILKTKLGGNYEK